MGADSFTVVYGVLWEVDASNEQEMRDLELRNDWRISTARKHGLDHWWGVTVDHQKRFLLVGKLFGNLGHEFEPNLTVADSELLSEIEETKRRLQAAGFTTKPALHFQFEPDY